MRTDYENSSPYRLGQMYKAMGELLMDPKTTVLELQQTADHYGVKLQFSLVPADEPQEQSE